tara:strand:+ start:83 stop:355 length:273 start_codon:yes stop_codon:yes gene_type:complete
MSRGCGKLIVKELESELIISNGGFPKGFDVSPSKSTGHDADVTVVPVLEQFVPLDSVVTWSVPYEQWPNGGGGGFGLGGGRARLISNIRF